jgi:DNA invertase Pin-like site-specific DNA recombinase
MAADPKVRPDHLRRQAVVYVRQSTPQQVLGNKESTARQYALADRAKALGWPAGAVQTIDDDPGRSGARSDHRGGFKALLAEIGAGQVGVVLALEASRLARSSVDWHRLVEICVVTKTLLDDESAVYDPRDPNDRLLLGLKGTLSEAELMTIRCRMHDGRWAKARRGELVASLPVGYVRDEVGVVTLHPDRQVQARLRYAFALFAELRVARRVVARLRQEKLKMPALVWGGPGHGQIRWHVPTYGALMRLLRSPVYAGAYTYGRKEHDSYDRSPTTGRARYKVRPVAEWPVCIRDAFPEYLSWEQFVQNQQTLRDNWFRSGTRGAPREGTALLQGIVRCGRCGKRMTVHHYSAKEQRAPSYSCLGGFANGEGTCQTMRSTTVDAAVAELILTAVTPARVEVALRVLDSYDADQAEARRRRQPQIQQAEYEADLARRRYEVADPANRLVASELEARWEQSLREKERLVREAEERDRQAATPLGTTERRKVREMAADLGTVWHAATTGPADRKELLRFLVNRVYLDGVAEAGQIRIEVEWHTGARTRVTAPRPAVGGSVKTSAAAVERIQELLPTHEYAAIVDVLNAEGFRTATGRKFNCDSVSYIARSRGWGRSARKRQARPTP